MVDPEVEARWVEVRQRVQAALPVGTELTARIPGWEPTSIDVALDWLRSHVYEGFYVDFQVEGALLWVKEWEYGQDEPVWDEVKTTPVRQRQPGEEVW